jgi:hypothetical protein
MNPSNNQTAGMPAPTAGQASVTLLPESGTNSAPAVIGQVPTATQGPQVIPMATIPLPLQTTAPSASPQTTATTGFQVADDKDVIEPEWVHKARAIVNHTTDDPYKQSEDLTVLKADYMQKRYNKIVKLK